MNIKINFKNKAFNKTNGNLILFVDEKFNISGLKKLISNFEYSYILDLLKSEDLKKNILFFDISSKRKIILVSIKNNIKSSDLETLGAKFAVKCNVELDEDINELPTRLKDKGWLEIDGYVHAIAYAPREAISGDLTDGLTKANFTTAHVISSYSFGAVSKSLADIFNEQSSILTISYVGATRFVPNYNVMGLAKASLEASVRYLAVSMGKEGHRVNAISAGPIKTLAASGVKNFRKMLSYNASRTPIGRNITTREVGDAATFLTSDMASGISGEILYVDGGFNTTAMGSLEQETS